MPKRMSIFLVLLIACPFATVAWGQDSDESQVAPTAAVTKFAKDVTVHVVLHELCHALIREFDLPVLANEETQADAFATFYLTNHMPDRAVDVIEARVRSLMIEAKELPREEWTVSGEHNSDARRAFQIVSIALASKPKAYLRIAEEIGMSDDEVRRSVDYGAEIHRSWRRILRPLWMEDGKVSTEIRFGIEEESKFVNEFCSGGLSDELKGVLGRFDWHSQVTIFFAEGDGGAGWNRGRRTITVNSEYVKRFIKQGENAVKNRK